MNIEYNNFTTPKQTKRLGLRRCSSTLKNDIVKKRAESAAKYTTTETETPTFAPKRIRPQSDCKINYEVLEQTDSKISTVCNVSSPSTPKNSNSLDVQRLAASTNCRPYRLALNKKVREKMTKKRLEFYLANEKEKEESQGKQMEYDQHEKDVTANKFNSREELLQLIEIGRKELESRQEHLKKVQELEKLINIWKTGFSLALHDLQQKIEPRLEIATLLERLHIPEEMIKYIND